MCKESETKKNTVQTSPIPTWLEDASKTLTEKSAAQAEKPFEAFTGDRVADLTPDQTNAFQLLRDFISGGRPQAAAKQYGEAPAPEIGTERVVDEGGRLGAIKDYLNPYVENALTPALARIQEQADARRKQINAGATSARAFGDARHGIVESTLDKNTSQAIGDTASNFMMNAFDKSMGTRATDLNRFGEVDKVNAQFDEAALKRKLEGGNAEQAQMLQQIQALLGAGATQQQTGQAEADAIYQEFIRKYQHDPQQLQILANVLAKLPYSQVKTTDETATQPDNSLLGTAGSVVGAVAGSKPVSTAIATALMGL